MIHSYRNALSRTPERKADNLKFHTKLARFSIKAKENKSTNCLSGRLNEEKDCDVQLWRQHH
jgi:hypothetical protein